MKKDKKFLLELEKELEKNNIKKKDAIVLKYKKIIEERLNNKEKITYILKDLGTVDEIVNNEKNISRKFLYNITRDMNDKEIINKFKSLFKKKDKPLKEKNIKKVKPIKEEYVEEIEEKVDEEKILYVEKPLSEEELKQKRKKEIISAILLSIVTFIWLWLNIVTIASCFAILDGVRIFGLPLTFGGLDLLVLWLDLLIINYAYKKFFSRKFKFISLFIIVFIISIGITLTFVEIFKIDMSSDPSEKYSMTTKIDTYNMLADTNKKMYLIFNSEYDTQYVINYDNNLDGQFKVEVDYYEGYYDYYVKKSSNNVYISLRKDYRDIVSTYISDLKDNKIYSSDELSRYIVKITISKNDYRRLVIED